MDRRGWKRKLINQCKEAGTYKLCYMSTIDILAEMMEIRDDAMAKFKESGADTVVIHKNQGGYENQTQNPALRIVNEYNKTVLTYLRELGLTPKGNDAIGEETASKLSQDPVLDVIGEFENEQS